MERPRSQSGFRESGPAVKFSSLLLITLFFSQKCRTILHSRGLLIIRIYYANLIHINFTLNWTLCLLHCEPFANCPWLWISIMTVNQGTYPKIQTSKKSSRKVFNRISNIVDGFYHWVVSTKDRHFSKSFWLLRNIILFSNTASKLITLIEFFRIEFDRVYRNCRMLFLVILKMKLTKK